MIVFQNENIKPVLLSNINKAVDRLIVKYLLNPYLFLIIYNKVFKVYLEPIFELMMNTH